ncbi:hypothetical protein BSG1_01545 [Bacillus sp. SG-1]|nr:hypothetical protein BSG1_01545 [Bacillus sp. SG-1]
MIAKKGAAKFIMGDNEAPTITNEVPRDNMMNRVSTSYNRLRHME